jgi:hypothetical protein
MTHFHSSKEIALEARDRAGERLSSPSAGRNKAVIAEALAGILPHGANVFEVASGTGEHALACVTRRTDLSWSPSEPNPDSRASVDAWALEAEGRIKPCLDLDVTASGWAADLSAFDALFCANMVHIAPWEAAIGIFEGAAEILSETGAVHLYGPFQEGAATAASNLQFDADLKRRDARWGVRALADLDDVAEANGLTRIRRLEMPKNNLIVSWTRAS